MEKCLYCRRCDRFYEEENFSEDERKKYHYVRLCNDCVRVFNDFNNYLNEQNNYIRRYDLQAAHDLGFRNCGDNNCNCHVKNRSLHDIPKSLEDKLRKDSIEENKKDYLESCFREYNRIPIELNTMDIRKEMYEYLVEIKRLRVNGKLSQEQCNQLDHYFPGNFWNGISSPPNLVRSIKLYLKNVNNLEDVNVIIF